MIKNLVANKALVQGLVLIFAGHIKTVMIYDDAVWDKDSLYPAPRLVPRRFGETPGDTFERYVLSIEQERDDYQFEVMTVDVEASGGVTA